MWEQIVNYMASNGVWALLFLGLLVYQLQDSKIREEKYTKTISSLTEGLNALEGIKQDIKSIIETIDSTANGLFSSKKKTANATEAQNGETPPKSTDKTDK